MAWDYNNESSPKIAILDSDGNQLFSTAVVMSAHTKLEKVYPEHTLENANVIFDDRYDKPTEVKVNLILSPDDYTSVYNDIYEAWNSGNNFTIMTRVKTFKNMYLPPLAHDETPDMADTIALTLSFKQMNFAKSTTTQSLSSDDVADSTDTSTVDSGSKSTTSDSDGSILTRLYDRVFGD